jgi:Fe-S cluster assembly protein SufD
MNVAVARTPAEIAYGGELLPGPRLEDWKWTNLRTLIDRPYPPRLAVSATAGDVERLLRSSPLAGLAAARMVFVNGRLDAGRSTLADGTTASRLDGGEPVLQLNAAFATGGARIALGGDADTPVELVFVSTQGEPRTVATRNVIEVAAGSSATLIESHIGEGSYLGNSVSEIRIGDGARLDRIKVEREATDAVHLAHAHVTLGKDAVLHDFTLTSGARVNRQNGTYRLAGEGARVKIAGAYLLAGRQHADTCLVVDHQVPRCESRELFKCVMDDEARGIFQGKVVVRPGAQKTDGKQSSHGLLLSPAAEFDAKPELEIFADDVICGHGATSGDLDHDQLFYLRSRGLPEVEAKALLIAAFVGEALDAIADDGIRAALAAHADGWFTGHGRAR